MLDLRCYAIILTFKNGFVCQGRTFFLNLQFIKLGENKIFTISFKNGVITNLETVVTLKSEEGSKVR